MSPGAPRSGPKSGGNGARKVARWHGRTHSQPPPPLYGPLWAPTAGLDMRAMTLHAFATPGWRGEEEGFGTQIAFAKMWPPTSPLARHGVCLLMAGFTCERHVADAMLAALRRSARPRGATWPRWRGRSRPPHLRCGAVAVASCRWHCRRPGGERAFPCVFAPAEELGPRPTPTPPPHVRGLPLPSGAGRAHVAVAAGWGDRDRPDA